ncbi:MAG TPA: xanthine dehydrogenase family protein subunit M [Alphaproteobacteria bacterium]
MKPAPFAYAKPSSLDQVFDLLDRHGESARLLAGGQSLVPTLAFRLSTPSLLIDLGGIPGLSGISVSAGVVRIGAMTRHAALDRSKDIARHLPLLAQAVPHIGHPAIRNRGTIGGSLAFADPAAELPACAVALDARLVLAGRGGRRVVTARNFFKGLYETDLRLGEVLVAVEFPALDLGYRSRFAELARRHGDYAMVGLAAHGRVDGERVQDVRLAFFGVGAKPVLATRAIKELEGQTLSPTALALAGEALGEDLDPPDDLNGSGKTKLHLARVMLTRTLREMSA